MQTTPKLIPDIGKTVLLLGALLEQQQINLR
jgi:hypothetical protein